MEKAIGSEGNLDLDLVDGNIVSEGTYEGKGLKAKLHLELNVGYYIDKLKEKTPASIDMLLDLLKGAIK
jgi:hypothetical protein